ncbi:MAG: ABC transporter ATP-binding protein [Geobacter sp.]|jgi:lipopolysaccharide transport system ATP-binding protein|nr:ABC transporter ATP-binding protein [Geobacter sp.]
MAAMDEHWVLRNLSFSILPGESVGIIGQNGAGKSTLLKLITGTLRPTEGACTVRGRVAAILELGMGFNPEFTGRQNVYHAAGLMGLEPGAVEEVIPEIESFAEIGYYFDQPVRTYSSGMQVRVAFAVATAFRPDILIVDEALSVGDIYFQQKCYERIRQFVTQGTTLLFVSHSMDTVLHLCSRALLLKDGGILHDGVPKDVIDLYQSHLLIQMDKAPEQLISSEPAVLENSTAPEAPEELKQPVAEEQKPGNLTSGVVACRSLQFLNRQGEAVTTLVADEETTLSIIFHVFRDVEDPHVGFKIRNRYGVVLFETNTYCMGQTIGPVAAGSELRVRFTFGVNLFPDDYTLTIGCSNKGYGEGSFEEVLSYQHEMHAFTVVRNLNAIRWAGMVNLAPQLQYCRAEISSTGDSDGT